MTSAYPERAREQDQWILAQRPGRNQVDPQRPYAFLLEEERAESGEVVPVTTIFLTNRECPWRCVMCDLWRNTLTETVPPGAIPTQIDYALVQLADPVAATFRLRSPGARLRPLEQATGAERNLKGAPTAARQIKLYNSGSFFDPRAIPEQDYEPIAARVRGFDRVIVECHPALIGERCLRFRDLLAGKLEVAMGLETAHPQVLAKLNKRMTLDQFRHAADFLRQNDLALRVFVLLKPPFLDETEALHWARKSIDFAFDCGATVVSLIPTRFGNGALEKLAERGEFSLPKLATLEAALEYGISLRRGRVIADVWDLEKFSDCTVCFAQRQARLHDLNLRQQLTTRTTCESCGLSRQA